ncbi:MAG: hypothetical protein IJ093_04015 [Bacilli bacterium]|nr:hypothetical protein [Bacilli bacterium]
MKFLVYAGIFVCKIIEDSLATLRLIVVANGKKKLGAILQFIASLVWVIVTSTVIINLTEDPLKVIFFALGSLVGSYFGSYLESKIALGTNTFTVEINKNVADKLISHLKKEKFNITTLQSTKTNKELLLITTKRKKTEDVIATIRSFDKYAFIVSEKVKIHPSHV